MPYAADGRISRDQIEGGIEITEQQYAEALDGMLAGLVVGIGGGFSVAEPVEPELEQNPEPTAEELEAALLASFISALESHYDTTAQSRRYDNRLTCALRAGYIGPFQAEGLAFATWMDECNAYAYEQMDLVKSGGRAQPTPDELVAELPPMVWP